MRSFLIVALFCLVGWSNSQKRKSQKCPAKYSKFTPYHTFCLPPNPTCQLKRTGVSQQDKELILRLHNQFRSKTAMGNEHRAKDGSLPQAADMMQMEWDDELAIIAQKWTDNCEWGHDCRECKKVENFAVGQNLAMQSPKCYGYGCQDPSDEPEWTWAITALYDEVLDYYKSWLGSFVKHPGPKTGHLTQMIWSRSWRVGCGYSFYKKGGGFHRYYACNYGPTGNVEYQPVYQQGRPCTACPINTQCSTSKRGPNSYPGLCKMINPNTAPEYPRDNKNGLLFYCGSSGNDPDCQARISGDGTWKTVRTLGGNYESLVLSGGQSAAISFNKAVKPYGNGFCIVLNFRKGPLGAGRDASSFKTDFKMENSFSTPSELRLQTNSFTQYSLDIPWNSRTKLGFTFSVPRGAGKHALDIKSIEVFEGECN